MPSDDPKIEDDFEDIDFDDVGEDMDDESWDDFDEDADVADMEAVDEEDPFAEEGEAAAVEAAPKKGKAKKVKSKSKKGGGGSSFTMIVIGGAVVIGGAIAYFTLFSGGGAPVPALQPTAEQANDSLAETLPADAPPADTSAQDSAFMDIEELSTDLPPMPAPVEGAMDEMAGTIEDIESISNDNLDLGDLSFDTSAEAPAEEASADDMPAMEEEGVLTPMPDLDSMDNTELADLDFDDSQQQQEAAMMDDLDKIEAMNAPEELPVAEEPADDMAADMMVTEEMPDLGMDAEIENMVEAPVEMAPAGEDQGELKALVNDLNGQLSAKDKSLSDATAENKALSTQLDKAETKISDLEAKIASLQEQLKSAKTVSDVATQPAKAPTKTTTSTTSAAPAKAETAAPKPAKSYSWTLRSASPESATLADQNGDMRNVEVGSSVPGLGRIESIAVQGGKWVVTGSQGSVSQ